MAVLGMWTFKTLLYNLKQFLMFCIMHFFITENKKKNREKNVYFIALLTTSSGLFLDRKVRTVVHNTTMLSN